MQEIKVSAKRCSEYLKRKDTDIMTPEQYMSWKQYMTDNPLKEWDNIHQVGDNIHQVATKMEGY
jgi:hypothetical protein